MLPVVLEKEKYPGSKNDLERINTLLHETKLLTQRSHLKISDFKMDI